jgi:mycothiol synthase
LTTELAAVAAPWLELVPRLTPELQARVHRIVQAARAADDGVAPFGEHKWLRLVRGDDRCSALLLWRDAELVGAAHCDAYHTSAPNQPCRLTAELVVHPDHRGQGLGRRLLEGVHCLARQEGADELHVWAYGNGSVAHHLARRFGFVPERVLLQMARPWASPPEPVVPPAGVRLRGFDPSRDACRWLRLHNRAFAGHPEQGDWQPSDLQARLEQPWFRARDLRLAESVATGDLLGFCWVKLPLDPGLPGEIYIVGVEPSARGLGLGQLVTRAGLAHIAAAGRPSAMLYVEADNQAAVGLYRGLGFEPRRHHVRYSSPVPPAGSAAAPGAGAGEHEEAVVEVADDQEAGGEGLDAPHHRVAGW